MSRASVTKTFPVRGMFCAHCEARVREALLAIPGVEDAAVSFAQQEAAVTYDPEIASLEAMKKHVTAAGYELTSPREDAITNASLLVILLGLWVIAGRLGLTQVFQRFPKIASGLSFGALFLTGLLTSVHCIAMCGGINLSQSALSARHQGNILKSNLLYQAGRVASYTVTGAAIGALGRLLSPGNFAKGAITLLAGAAMLLMALSMLGIFRPLRRLRLAGGVYKAFSRLPGAGSSLAIGLMNGLMPCGPLQSMQLLALSAGSAAGGAAAMLCFALGTVPLMLGFGLFAGRLNQKHTRVMLRLSALLIVCMGIAAIANGLSLMGVSLPQRTMDDAIAAMQQGDVQTLYTEIDYGAYPAVRVKAGMPVEWHLTMPEGKLNGCNGEVLIPAFGLIIPLTEGDNLIRFTPDTPGVYPYSCWMGMIRSSIEVTE